MAQNINQAGKIEITVEKNVVFNKRELKDITINGGDYVTIRYTKLSNEGNKQEMLVVPFDRFNEVAENYIWEVVDETLMKNEK